MSIKISELPSAETLGENDIVPIVQDGTTKKITAGTFKADNATVINSSSTNATPAGAKAVYDYAAPISHADENTTYGQGTESKFGHCKTINNLTASEYTAGEALSSYQGKLLKDAIDGLDEDKQDVIDALHKIGSDSVEDGTFEGNEQSNRFIKVITDDRSLEVKDFATGTYLLKAGVDLALNGVLPAEIVNFGNDTLMITKATDDVVFYYIFDNTDNEDHCRLLYGYEDITERTGTHKYLNIDDIPSTAGGNIDITNGVISTIGNTIKTLDATNDIIINDLNVGVYQVRDNATYKFKSGTGDDYASFTISSQTFMVVSQIEAELPVPTTPKYYYIVDIQNGDVHYGYCKWLNSTQGYSGTHYIIDQSELVDKDYLETKLAEKQAEIDELYDQIPTATATGYNINVQDSSNLPLKNVELLGNAIQSENILPNTSSAWEQGSINYNTGETMDSTTRLRTKDYFEMSTGTYQIKIENSNYCFLNIMYYDTNKNFIIAQSSVVSIDGLQTATITVTNSSIKYAKCTIRKTSDATITASDVETAKPTISNIPSPDYPQDIHVVTGDNTLNIAHKNLLKLAPNSNSSRNNTTCTITDNIINLKNTGATTYVAYGIDNELRNTNYGNYVTWKGTTLKKGTYTLICKYISGSTTTTSMSQLSVVLYPKADGSAQITNARVKIGTSNESSTFTLDEDTDIKVSVYMYSSNATIDINFQVMILAGSVTDYNYEPYITPQTQLISLGNIELAKIGDYTDRIFKDSGKWYLYKEIGKVILNGSEGWWRNASAGRYQVAISDIAYGKNMLSNSLIIDTTYGTKTDDYTTFAYQSGYIWVYQSTITELNNFKAFLAEKQPILYYALRTPTTTEITDTTLIGQLENILQMHTNKNVTNAWIEPSGTNAQAGLTLTYRQDLATLIAG